MTEQLPLIGPDGALPTKRRLFYALRPDKAATAQIVHLAQRLQDAHGLTGKLIPPDRLHVTVHYIGEYKILPAYLIPMLSRAAATVEIPPFDIRLDRVVSFSGKPGNRPLVLLVSEGAQQVAALGAAFETALRKNGMTTRPPSPTPHLTIAYDARKVPEQPMAPIAWRAQEFAFVESHVGLGKHVVRGRWLLR